VVSYFLRAKSNNVAQEFFTRFIGKLTSNPISSYNNILHLLNAANNQERARQVRQEIENAAKRKGYKIGVTTEGEHKGWKQVELKIGSTTYVANKNQYNKPQPGQLVYIDPNDSQLALRKDVVAVQLHVLGMK
jgi:hypothetical protein